jgi:hypothetical protein
VEQSATYLGEGSRSELEPLRAVLAAAGIAAAIGPPPKDCTTRT